LSRDSDTAENALPIETRLRLQGAGIFWTSEITKGMLPERSQLFLRRRLGIASAFFSSEDGNVQTSLSLNNMQHPFSPAHVACTT